MSSIDLRFSGIFMHGQDERKMRVEWGIVTTWIREHHNRGVQFMALDTFGKRIRALRMDRGLSRSEQETARKKLLQVKTQEGAPVWAEERRGVPARMWYRVDVAALFQCILESGDGTLQLAGIPPSSWQESDQQVGDDAASQLAGKSPTFYSENTTDINAQKRMRPTPGRKSRNRHNPEDRPKYGIEHYPDL